MSFFNLKNADRLSIAGWVILAVLGLYGTAILAYTGILRAFYPYGLNLGEAPLAQAIQLFSSGTHPYHRLNQPPFTLVPYGPVYLAFASAASGLIEGVFAPARCVSLLATAAAAFLTAYAAAKISGKRRAGIPAFFLFATNPYVSQWGVQVNVDMTAHALSLASLALYLVYFKSEKPVYLCGGALVNVLAFFTKASTLACPAALLLVLITEKKWRHAVLWVSVLASGILSGYFALNAWTQGGYYFHTTYEIGHRLFFFELITRYWSLTLEKMPLNVLACVLCLIGLGTSGSRSGRLLRLYLMLSVLTTLSLGKQGSDTNYFLEWCMLSSVAAGVLLAYRTNRFFQGAGLALVLIQLIAFVLPFEGRSVYRSQMNERRGFYDEISKMIRKTPGPVLSWDMSLLVANGKPVYYEAFPMAQMSYSGVWDETPILQDLNARKFKLAILYFYAPMLKADRNFTPGFMEAFKRNYVFRGRVKLPPSASAGETQYLFFYTPKE